MRRSEDGEGGKLEADVEIRNIQVNMVIVSAHEEMKWKVSGIVPQKL